MKVFITFLCWFGISINHSFSQSGGSTIKSTDERVKNILSSIDNCEREERVNDEAGSDILYNCGTEKVVQIRVIENKVNKEVTWIYENDSLIYVEQRWTHLNGVVIDYEKFYLNKKELFAWLKTNGSFVDVNSDEFIKLSRDLKTQTKPLMRDAD
jgi:hypothetical protein